MLQEGRKYPGPPLIFLQDACREHRPGEGDIYINQTSERLEAVSKGLAAALAHLEAASTAHTESSSHANECTPPITIVRSSASADILQCCHVHRAYPSTSGDKKLTRAEEIVALCKYDDEGAAPWLYEAQEYGPGLYCV